MDSPTTPTGPPVPRQNPSRPSLRSSISGQSDGLSPSSVHTLSTLASPRPAGDYASPKPGQLDVEAPTTTTQYFERAASGSPHLLFNTVFASARVGLGSPALELKRDWLGHRRRSSDEPDHDHNSSPGTTLNGDTSISPHKLVDPKSGLPSPPGSNSDIGPPTTAPLYNHEMAPSSPSSHISPPRPPRRTSSISSAPKRSPSLSSASSSRVSEARLRESLLKARSSPSVARSNASSPHLVRVNSHTSGAGNQLSSSASGPTHNVENGVTHQPQDSRDSPSSSRASSPRKSRVHGRSPSLPLDSQLLRSSGLGRQVAEEAGQGQSSPSGVDDRILEAEKRIKSATRPPRLSMDVQTPGQSSSKRHGFYGRPESGTGISTASLRRSMTAATSSAASKDTSVQGITPRGDIPEQSGSSGRQREKSGGSGSSGRRKALPAEFRGGSGLVCLLSPRSPVLELTVVHAIPSQSFVSTKLSFDRPTILDTKAE